MGDSGKTSTREEQTRRLAESMKRQLGALCGLLHESDVVELTGGIRASNREPSSGSSHSRIGFSRVTVLRNVLATVAMKDSAVAGGIVPAGCIGWPRRSTQTVPSAFST
jgi:hypothetical protein